VDVVKDPDGVKARIGYMAQKFSLYDDLTVAENIEFFAEVYLVPTDKVEVRKREVVEIFQLTGLESTRTKTLPGGIKQRLSLACSLVHEPRILFLDEPTAGVDPLSRRSFWRQIQTLRMRGVTIFVTTHHLDEAENCTEVLFMKDGKTVGLGPPRLLRQKADKGELVRVAGVDPQALKASARIKDFTPMGPAWHVWLRTADDAPLLSKELGVPVERVRPSLEDVFLDAIGETGR
jgi:ABC-2 type transport system ATP-binding protein